MGGNSGGDMDRGEEVGWVSEMDIQFHLITPAFLNMSSKYHCQSRRRWILVGGAWNLWQKVTYEGVWHPLPHPKLSRGTSSNQFKISSLQIALNQTNNTNKLPFPVMIYWHAVAITSFYIYGAFPFYHLQPLFARKPISDKTLSPILLFATHGWC